MEDFKSFRESILKTTDKKFKVTDRWGVYDAYKYIRKNGWQGIGSPVTEHEFYSIIRTVNKYLAAEIAKGNTVKFPYSMGKLELRKIKTGASFKDGKLKVTYPIDWDKTLRLWFEDKEAKKSKLLIRNETSEVYKVKYSKYGTNFNNRCFYDFTLNRFIRHAIHKNIEEGIITDTLYVE